MNITQKLFDDNEFKEYFINKTSSQEKRIIKIELNPYKKSVVKFKMKTPKVNNLGQPIARKIDDLHYKVETSLEDVSNLLRTPGTTKILSPVRSSDGLKTGLDIMVTNPYYSEKGKDKHKFRYEWAERVLSDPKVKLQHLLEYKHDREFDYYTNKISDTPISNDKPDKKYFEKSESKLRLSNNTTILDLDNPQQELQYYLALVHPAIANSLLDCEEGSQADWYIVDDKERVKKKLDKTDKIIKYGHAITLLTTSNDPLDNLKKMAKALDISQANNPKIQIDDLKVTIQEFVGIFETTRTELSVEKSFSEFMTYFEWFQDAGRRNMFEAAADLFDYIQYRLVTYDKGKYKLILPVPQKQNEYIEHIRDTKHAFIVDFLCDPRYSADVELLKQSLKNKQA